MSIYFHVMNALKLLFKPELKEWYIGQINMLMSIYLKFLEEC